MTEIEIKHLHRWKEHRKYMVYGSEFSRVPQWRHCDFQFLDFLVQFMKNQLVSSCEITRSFEFSWKFRFNSFQNAPMIGRQRNEVMLCIITSVTPQLEHKCHFI